MKLLLTDLDGTLLDKEAGISDGVKSAVNKLKEGGYAIVLASGRHPDMMKYVAHALDLTMPVIGCNGAVIKDLNRNQVLYIKEIPRAVAKDCCHLAGDYGIPVWVYAEDGIYYTAPSPRLERMRAKNDGLCAADRFYIRPMASLDEVTSRVIKILMIFETHSHLKPLFHERLKGMANLTVCESHKFLLDIMAPGMDKKHGMAYFRKEGYNHFVAIGDSENDKGMIGEADIGIAMENASQTVKDVANYITASNEAEGFAKAVAHILHEPTTQRNERTGT